MRQEREMRRKIAMDKVYHEYLLAMSSNPPFNTAHEGWAVIKEEMDELWDLVKSNKKPHGRATLDMETEATQVAAMAVRFLIDLCPVDEDETIEEYSARAREMPER